MFVCTCNNGGWVRVDVHVAAGGFPFPLGVTGDVFDSLVQ